MNPALKRSALAFAAAVFLASALPALSADSPLGPAVNALSTTLTSDDTYTLPNGKIGERQLSVTFAAKASGTCEVTVHRDGTSTFPYAGLGAVQTATVPLTYYMVPLDAMSSGLSVANAKSSQQAATKISGESHSVVLTYSEDTVVPLAGLKSADPVQVSSQSPPPKYPTYTSAAAAKAAIAALAAAAASCGAAPASK
jgi:hypothetical protein